MKKQANKSKAKRGKIRTPELYTLDVKFFNGEEIRMMFSEDVVRTIKAKKADVPVQIFEERTTAEFEDITEVIETRIPCAMFLEGIETGHTIHVGEIGSTRRLADDEEGQNHA